MIKAIEHIGICAEDTEILAYWYVNVLGFKIIKINTTKVPNTFFVGVENCQIEIFSSDEVSSPLGKKVQGLRHIALVPENFEECVQGLKDKGVEIIDDAKTSATAKTLFFRDPEGNILHLFSKL